MNFFGFGHLLIHLRIFNHVWFAVFQYNQTYGFLCVSFADNFCCNVDILWSCEADENRVSDLDEAIVDAVSMDMLDATSAHIRPRSRHYERLIYAAICIRSNGDLT